MEIDLKFEGISLLNVKASGRLDLDSAVQYGTTIKDAIEDAEEEITELILDFSDITFISSYGLKVILELFKLMQDRGSMKLKNVSEQINKAFKMVGFDKFLIIENV